MGLIRKDKTQPITENPIYLEMLKHGFWISALKYKNGAYSDSVEVRAVDIINKKTLSTIFHNDYDTNSWAKQLKKISSTQPADKYLQININLRKKDK